MEMRRMEWVVAAAMAAALWLGAGLAQAQQTDDAQARLHFEAGASHYEAGDYKLALEEFQRAYEISKRPELFYNMSLAYQQLGDYENAIKTLSRYLDETQNVPNRANLERRLVNLQERLDEQKAQQQQEQQEQQQQEQPPPAGTTQPPPVTTTGGGLQNDTAVHAVPPPEEHHGGIPVGAWIGWGVGASGLLAGAIVGGLALKEKSDVESMPCAATRTCTSSQVKKMDRLAHTADVLIWGVGAGGVLVGTILFFVTRDHGTEKETARMKVTPWMGTNGGGAVVQGRF